MMGTALPTFSQCLQPPCKSWEWPRRAGLSYCAAVHGSCCQRQGLLWIEWWSKISAALRAAPAQLALDIQKRRCQLLLQQGVDHNANNLLSSLQLVLHLCLCMDKYQEMRLHVHL